MFTLKNRYLNFKPFYRYYYFNMISVVFIVFLMTNIQLHIYGQEKNNKRIQYIVTDTIYMNSSSSDFNLQISFVKGNSHNHPTFAIWIEDKDSNYIETLFVTQYIASGTFAYADAGNGTWKNRKGEALRPAALPYWTHKRDVISRDSLYVPTPENPVSDAITGATPKGSFVLRTIAKQRLPKQFRMIMEINQPWDWNDYWYNDKYPDDNDYKTSAQPSVIFVAEIDLDKNASKYSLKPVGHGHYSGKTGDIYTDLSSLTTALEIAKSIEVVFY